MGQSRSFVGLRELAGRDGAQRSFRGSYGNDCHTRKVTGPCASSLAAGRSRAQRRPPVWPLVGRVPWAPQPLPSPWLVKPSGRHTVLQPTNASIWECLELTRTRFWNFLSRTCASGSEYGNGSAGVQSDCFSWWQTHSPGR